MSRERGTGLGILRFEEGYFERIWGGKKLKSLFAKRTPDAPIGEAWLIADHPVHESVVSEGTFKGRSLRDLLREDAGALLGERPRLTPHGRFPLLLKLLDAKDVLSVQVHPDDDCARALNEPDVGKTEMWHVLQADSGSELICGLEPSISPAAFMDALADKSVEKLMMRIPAKAGMSLFVPAGTVHAIGGGIVLAEIQQNSDLTYRVYDWGRVGSEGRPRELHVEKAVKAVHFGQQCRGAVRPLEYWHEGVHCTVLAACEYFAAELVRVKGSCQCETNSETFHLVLATKGKLFVRGADEQLLAILPGETLLVPGCLSGFTVEGEGAFLNYYVPDIEKDIVEPLVRAGYVMEDVRLLGDF